jgi:hypothetical protein
MRRAQDPSRRAFMTGLAQAAVGAPFATALARADLVPAGARVGGPQDWDLSWADALSRATDRAVFDWAAATDAEQDIVPQIAARYLDGCEAVYGAGGSRPAVVLNIRTRAVPAALTDDAWARYELGASYGVKDPETGAPATRNPFWRRSTRSDPATTSPSLQELLARGAVILVCDFALGHLADRLAAKAGRPPAEVHQDLRRSFVPSATAVPSGIFGLARAQNAGCALIRM